MADADAVIVCKGVRPLAGAGIEILSVADMIRASRFAPSRGRELKSNL